MVANLNRNFKFEHRLEGRTQFPERLVYDVADIVNLMTGPLFITHNLHDENYLDMLEKVINLSTNY